MDGENYLFIAFRRLMGSAGFTASFIGAAAYLLVPNAELAIVVGGVIGLPTGVTSSTAKTIVQAMARAAGVWAVLLGVLPGLVFIANVFFANRRITPDPACLAFLATVVSITALSAGCSHLFCRAVAPEVGQPSRVQISLADAMELLALLAVCLASAIWWKQQAPEVFEILANPGFRTLPPG